MATSRSAKKRIRKSNKWQHVHKGVRSEIKTLVKKEIKLLDAKDLAKATELYQLVQQKLDKAAEGHSLHKNTVARRKSRLMKRLNKLKAGGAAPAAPAPAAPAAPAPAAKKK